MTHRSIEFAEWVSKTMRTWLWLSTGMSTKEWVACHRKHHAHPDTPEDPHSPVQEGLSAIVFFGVKYYRKAVADKEMVKKFGYGCPEDRLEKEFFIPYRQFGIYLLLFINLVLFACIEGFLIGLLWGLSAWLCQILWMIVTGQIVNGIGHSKKPKNKEIKDHSVNFLPIGILIAGEELHKNHHASPQSPKFSKRWWQFDIGWLYIKIMQRLRMITKIRYAPAK